MTSVPVDATDLRVELASDALLRTSARVARLLRQAPEPGANACGVWSIAETAVHLSQSSHDFLAAAQGKAVDLEPVPNDGSFAINSVAAEPERHLDVLAGRIERGEQSLTDYARTTRNDPQVKAFLNIDLPLSAVLGLELAELQVHGRDIALAAGVPWTIDSTDATLALRGVMSMLPHMIDPKRAEGLRMTCEVRVRHGFRALVAVDDGAAATRLDQSGAADCRLTVDPVALLLLAYNRVGPFGPIARGKVVPWGRRPWLVVRLLSSVASA